MSEEAQNIDPEASVEVDDVEQDVEHFSFHVGKNIVRRIDQYLTDRISYLSRSGVQRLIGEGLVKVNGRVIKSSYHPRSGDQIEMVAPPKPVNEIIPEAIPLTIVYEDDDFLAINKQSGLMVHPARGVWTGTLVNALIHYGTKWSNLNGPWRPGILHRLDRNTTGIMLVAKSDEAHWRLARQFETRTIQKTYLAVAQGKFELLGDIIDMPIGPDRYVREKQGIRKIENGGRQATTKYEVMEKFTLGSESYAFLRLSPKTGRTHQLRVHMTAIGHPLVGDTMYGGRVFEAASFKFERQALHASEITFTHPVSLQKMTLKAELPPDLSGLLGMLRQRKVDEQG